MPRCKPKRFHRNRKYRVARRKKKRRDLVNGTSRNRKKRDKNGKVIQNIKVIKKMKNIIERYDKNE